jgi:ABC-type nickel/cobalt efflux system permease component RcnA
MTLSLLPVLLTALIAGSAHALEPDHMAAVTAFVSRRPHPMRALGFGVRWALGHSLALLFVGGTLVALNLRFSAGAVRSLELGVGVMLLALGAWALAGVLGNDRHPHDDAEPAHPHRRSRAHGTTWVGLAHGLAGVSGFLAILPAALLGSPWAAGGYVLAFGIGTVLAMGGYALAAGTLIHRAGTRAFRLGYGLRLAAALATLAVGVFWTGSAVG